MDLDQATAATRFFNTEIAGAKPETLSRMVPTLRLQGVGNDVQQISASMLDSFKVVGDTRYLRAHLMLEELGEVLIAMSCGDEIGTLDGLADLSYVTHGTAAQYDLPLGAAFEEVHRSNCTKRRRASDPDGARVRDKGDNYEPPNLHAVLSRYRSKSADNKVKSKSWMGRLLAWLRVAN